MAQIQAKSEFLTTFTNEELSLVVRALIGRPRREDEEPSRKLARYITEERAKQLDHLAQTLRAMLPKEETH